MFKPAERPAPDEAPEKDILGEEELRDRLAALLAENTSFRTSDAELSAQAAEAKEVVPDREYWSYKEKLLPIATEAEMEAYDLEMIELIDSGETFDLPFRFETPPGHDRELVFEGIFNNRLYKLVVPRGDWDLFKRLSEEAEGDQRTCTVIVERPYRISPRRSVAAAYPVEPSEPS